MSRNRWIAVDLDGTLAHYVSGQGVKFVGAPIPAMVERVKAWLADGKLVKIFTARVCGLRGPEDRQEQVSMIQAWCLEHIGQSLEVTAVKDFHMIELWDDRAHRVEKNTGRVLGVTSPRYIKADPEPIYDEVYEAGVRALDAESLTGGRFDE